MNNKFYLFKVYNAIAIFKGYDVDYYKNSPSFVPNLQSEILTYLNNQEAQISGLDFTNFYSFLWRDENTDLIYQNYVADAINQFQTRFYEWNIELINEKDANQPYLLSRSIKFVERLCNTISNLYPKYAKLLELYASKQNELINDISVVEVESRTDSASGIARVNDTPQESGDYSTNDYTSSVSKTESSGSTSNRKTRAEQKDTYINLLKEVEEKLSNIMLAFVNEIGYRLTWYSGGGEYEE